MNKEKKTCSNNKPKISDDSIDFLISEVTEGVDGREQIVACIESAARALNEVNRSTLEYALISSMTSKKHIGVPFKVRGYIKTFNEVAPGYSNDVLLDRFTIELQDTDGNSIETATICDDQLINRVRSVFMQHQILDFYGCIIPKAIYTTAGKFRKLVYVCLLADLSIADDPIQMVQATKSEIAKVSNLVKSLSRQHGGIVEHIRERLIEIIGIKGLEDTPLLDRSLRAIIYQALSDGYDSKRSLSHRIHTLVIGSPAVGKKLLTEAARILNPVFTEGQPGKITVPGIAGRAMYKDGAWQSEPGLIPLAHRGVFVIQDFHHVEKKKDIMGVLSPVMEDGKVIDSTAACKMHHALTAIHIDSNKHSDVYLTPGDDTGPAGYARLGDIGLAMNVLTRFDFIVDIPRDTERQMEIGLLMHTGAQKTSRYSTSRKISTAERELKVLIAYLRTQYADIEIPEALIETHIRDKQRELMDRNHDQLKNRQLLGDYQTRLSNSVHKLTFAIARSNARSKATAKDVDDAFRFLKTKLEFLATIEPFETPETWNREPKSGKVEKRQRFIRQHFSSREVTVEEVQKAVEEKYGENVSRTTIRRDLGELAEKPRHGTFKLPDFQNGEMAK
ncbi:hypothetical protein KKG05_09760 [bacterium]|nr:hypothetical protein [bacterium]